MKYEVYITARAERQLKAAADHIASKAPQAALRWYQGFVKSILQIGENPNRFGVIRERQSFPSELRQLLYGRRRNYRAIFTIRDDRVVVLAIRHAAQDDLTMDDLTSS